MMEKEKISFFERVKIAVVKLENYSIFLEEKCSIAIKYFFLIVLILAVCMAIVETYTIMKIVNKGYEYLQNELPEFSYLDGKLNFSENVQAYDEEYDLYMIVDTSDTVTEEKRKEYSNTIKTTGVIFLKDKAIYQDGSNVIEYTYRDFANQYGIDTLDKTSLIEGIDEIGQMGIAVTIFLVTAFGLYIVELLSIFMDWLVMTIFTIISARICRIAIAFKPAFNISIYALTLSIILTMLYNIAHYLTGFYTEYFRVVYLLIAYVYIVAVILMIKSDLIKQQIEIAKVVKAQKETQEELGNLENPEEQKKKEKKKPKEEDDKKEEKSDGDDTIGQPDGSEI